MTASSHPEDSGYVPLVRTLSTLSGWSLDTLLTEYGDRAVRRREAVQLDEAALLAEVEADMAALADEFQRRTKPPTVEQPNLVAATYVRHTVDRLTAETIRPGQDTTIWDYCHLLSIIGQLAAYGYVGAVVVAADRVAADYGLPAQSVVDTEAEVEG